jgi:hypothetical protein
MKRIPSILLLVLSFAAPAQAQETDERVAVKPTHEISPRKGIFLGVGLGGGGMSFLQSGSSVTKGAALVNIRVGLGLNERLLVMAENHEAATSIDGEMHAVGTLSVAAQYFVKDGFYVRPGIGIAIAHTRNPMDLSQDLSTQVGFSILGAAGYEFRRGQHFALSPEIELRRPVRVQLVFLIFSV